jgi:hypothetical protein
MLRKVIRIDLTNLDLLESDRRDLGELLESSNRRLEAGNLGPLRMSVETWRSALWAQSKQAELDAWSAAIASADRECDAPLTVALRTVRASRVARHEAVDALNLEISWLIG